MKYNKTILTLLPLFVFVSIIMSTDLTAGSISVNGLQSEKNGAIKIRTSGEVDLSLNVNPDSEYISYLETKETEYLQQLLSAANDEPTMKAYMGLTLINLSYNYIDTDTSGEVLDSLFTNVFDLLGQMVFTTADQLFQILGPVDSLHDLVFSLISYIEAGNISEFENTLDSLKTALDSAKLELSDSLEAVLDRYLENMDQASEYFGALMDSTADFTFSFDIIGSEFEDTIFVVTREFLDHLQRTSDQFELSLDEIDQGMNSLDSIFQTSGGDVSPAVVQLRNGLDEFRVFLQMASDLSTMQPLSPLEIDTTIFDSLAMVADEIDTLLGGKAYPFGPEDDQRDFVPLAVLEAVPDGLNNVFREFYWLSTDPYTYDFHGIFPQGLPEELVDIIIDDLIANTYSNREAIEIEIELKRIHFEWMLNNYPPPLGDGDPSNDGDAHFGLALITLYTTFRDLGENLWDIFRYLETGQLDSLAYNYELSDLDISGNLDQIQTHLDAILEDEYYTVFTILVKTVEDQYPDFVVDEGSEFYPVWINEDQIAIFADALAGFRENYNNFLYTAEALWDSIGAMMDVNLDPSSLDFSEVECDSDIILILESANPNFLTLTPYGEEKFRQMGDAIEEVTYEFASALDYLYFLTDTLSLYEDSLNMDFTSFLETLFISREVLWGIHEDFAYPDSTIYIDGERVNLSAWFDNPPQSFLLMWKNFVWGVDSTLGGLFPDRKVTSTEGGFSYLPRTIELFQNYPNPFNPGTYITYDLPKRTPVKLEIYDLLGKRVFLLVDEIQNPGRKTIYFDASELSSGMYFYRLTTKNTSYVRKMLYLK